jgi:hypothetical protein
MRNLSNHLPTLWLSTSCLTLSTVTPPNSAASAVVSSDDLNSASSSSAFATKLTWLRIIAGIFETLTEFYIAASAGARNP